MSEHPESSDTPNTPQPGESTLTAEMRERVRGIQAIEELHRTIQTELRSENFLDRVVSQLIRSPLMRALIDQLIMNRLGHMVAEASAAQAQAEAADDNKPKLVELRASQCDAPDESTGAPEQAVFRVVKEPSDDGMTHPITVTMWDGKDYVSIPLNEVTSKTFNDFLLAVGAEVGQPYYCSLFQYWDRAPQAKAEEPAGATQDDPAPDQMQE